MKNDEDESSWTITDIQNDTSASTNTSSTRINKQTACNHPRTVETTPDLPIQGILRKPSIAKRQLSITSFPPTIERPWWYFWKHGSLAIIPIVGYILSRLHPSSMLLHCTFLCFIYGIVDLMGQDPNLPILATTITTTSTKTTTTQDSKLNSTMDHYRLRRVEFVDGTKFYRMPKPMSRKQKQAYRDHRLQSAALTVLSTTNHQQQQQQQQRGGGGGSEVSEIFSDRRTIVSPTSLSIGKTAMTFNPSPANSTSTIMDWELTTQRLKSILEPRPLQEDLPSSRDLDFQDAQQSEITNSSHGVEQWPSSSSLTSSWSLLLQENIDPLRKSHASLASSKLLEEGASTIARLRMATKPLQPVNQPQH